MKKIAPRNQFFSVLFITITAFLGGATSSYAQNTQSPGAPLTISVNPTFSLPLDPNNQLIKYGIGGGLRVQIGILEFLEPFVDVCAINFQSPADSVSFPVVNGALGIQGRFGIGDRFGLLAEAQGGGYFLTWKDKTAANLSFQAGAGAFLRISPALNLQAIASYQQLYLPDAPLFEGLAFDLSLAFIPNGLSAGNRVFIQQEKLDPIFPVFHSWYDSNSFGTVKVVNGESATITDVRVSFFVKQYMDQPKLSFQVDSLTRAGSIDAPLNALFTESVLKLTETTKVQGEVIIDYKLLDTPMQSRYSTTIRMNHRNAMSWDDDRKAAAFVSPRDPAVLRYAKFVAGLVRDIGDSEISENLRLAMGLFEGMYLCGVNYVIDPSTPYKELSASKSSVDYLQFPFQTLIYKGGDCDDLSILYASALESVGIGTAFITVPGHIYVAIDLNMRENDARRTFSNPDNFVFVDGRAWLPVEITMLKEGFLRAWQTASQEWNQATKTGEAALIPIHQAWETYEPVGIPGEDTRIVLPESEQITRAYRVSLDSFVHRELDPAVQKIRNELANTPNDARILNRLGVLYARYGMLTQARQEFEKATRAGTLSHPWTNLGNIALLKKDYAKAIANFRKAIELDQDDTTALQGLTRALFESGDKKSADVSFQQLLTKDPTRASRLSFMGNGTNETGQRAARIGLTADDIQWNAGE